MKTKLDLEKICNYSENTKPSLPVAQIMYIDYTNDEDERLLRELKRKKRELSIDSVLDEESEIEES